MKSLREVNGYSPAQCVSKLYRTSNFFFTWASMWSVS